MIKMGKFTTIFQQEKLKKLSNRNKQYFTILALMIFIVPFISTLGYNLILSVIDNNPNNLMNYPNDIEFKCEGKFNDLNIQNKTLLLSNRPQISTEYSSVSLKFNESESSFETYKEDGYIRNTKKFTIYWIKKNPYLSIINSEYDVIDHLGVVGKKGELLKLTILSRELYWANDNDLNGLQLVNIFELENGDGEVVAKGILDDSSGLLIFLETDTFEIKLDDPNTFPITLDEIFGIYISLILLIIGVVFIYFRKRDDENVLSYVSLGMMGMMGIFMDCVFGLWYFAVFEPLFYLLIHLIVMIIFIGIILYNRKPIKWILPVILEISFTTLLYFLIGASFYEISTISIGFTLSFFSVLFSYNSEEEANIN